MHHQAETQEEEHIVCSSLETEAVVLCEVDNAYTELNKQAGTHVQQNMQPQVNTGKLQLSMSFSCVMPEVDVVPFLLQLI